MTTVNVTIDKNGVIQVAAPGPQGTRGPTGPTGPPGPVTLFPYKVFTPETYGAKRDGVTDDQAAFAAMFAAMTSGSVAMLSAGQYLCSSGALTPPPGTSTLGQGPATLIKTNASVPLFKLLNCEDTEIGRFNIQGNSTQTGLANGIVSGFLGSDGANRLLVHDVTAINFGDVAFSAAYGPTGVDPGPMFQNCRAISCTRGFDSFQYTQVLGCSAVGCGIGLNLPAGNCVSVGCDWSSNTTGVYIGGGGNDGHCIVADSQINHCSTHAIFVSSGLTNGQTFRGCHVYGSDISIIANPGIVDFVGCSIDPASYTFNASLTRFFGCVFPLGNANTINNLNAPTTSYVECIKLNGTAYTG